MPLDSVSARKLGPDWAFGLRALANGEPQQAIIRFDSGSAQQAKFLVTANNPYQPSITDFTISNPAIAPCPL